MPAIQDIQPIVQFLDDVEAGKVTELNEPGQWPIKNALRVIRETMKQYDPDNTINPERVDYAKGVYMALGYATEIIRSINKLKPPEPQDPVEEFKKAQRDHFRDMATSYEMMAERLRAIARGETVEEMREW